MHSPRPAGAGGRHRRPEPFRGRHRTPASTAGTNVWRGCLAALLLALLATGSVSAAPAGRPADTAAVTAHLRQRGYAAEVLARAAEREPAASPSPPRPAAAAPAATPSPSPPGGSPTPAPTGPEPGPSSARPTRPSAAPVGGLSERQMDHAATIVEAGQRAGLPEYAYVVAIATALQESNLRNLANSGVPESFDHDHDGTGADHDSVGLFQQRFTMGWGTVAQLMDPAYAAARFYEALARVPGWQDLPVTRAAQAVQRSAFPDHYAKHEPLARQVVDALT